MPKNHSIILGNGVKRDDANGKVRPMRRKTEVTFSPAKVGEWKKKVTSTCQQPAQITISGRPITIKGATGSSDCRFGNDLCFGTGLDD